VGVNPFIHRFFKAISRLQMWLLVILFLLVTYFQFSAYFNYPTFLANLNAESGLTRYTVERIFYLLPITWAAFSFGWKAGAITSLVALICMLPRALFSSSVREDALVETIAVFMVGNLISYSLESLRKERRRRVQLEVAQEEGKRMQESLHYLLQQITRAQEEERKRIARELHDDTIQALVVHCQQIYDLAYNEQGLPRHAFKRMEELRSQINNTIRELRRLSQDLRPPTLERLGLMPALRHLASDVVAHSGIPVDVKMIGTERRLTAEAELVLFRIVQEALRNSWKHAEATLVKVTVEFAEGKIKVTIEDNGKGFDVYRIANGWKQGKLGLAGMKERTELLGGTFMVTSELGKGTILTAELQM
jgi:two-component system sensor histidine kinase DegS